MIRKCKFCFDNFTSASHIIALTCTLTSAAPPPPPETIAVTTSLNNYTVSWSPPLTSDLGVGGVVGYVVSVTGEGCGCVSVNVSTNTTSLTCSGWKVKGQTCVFEVRTLTQCGLLSDRVVESVTLAVPLTPTQLSVKADYNYGRLQSVKIEFVGVNTTLYNNVSYVIEAYGTLFYLHSEDCENFTNLCILRISAYQFPAYLGLQVCSVFGCGDSVLTQITANHTLNHCSPASQWPEDLVNNWCCSYVTYFTSTNDSRVIVAALSVGSGLTVLSVIVWCLLLTVLIVIFIGIFFAIGNRVYKKRQNFNNLKTVELVSYVIHNPVTSETSATEHTSVFIEEQSMNSDSTEVEQKKKCKDIVPGSNEEEIFASVVHTSYEDSVQENTE